MQAIDILTCVFWPKLSWSRLALTWGLPPSPPPMAAFLCLDLILLPPHSCFTKTTQLSSSYHDSPQAYYSSSSSVPQSEGGASHQLFLMWVLGDLFGYKVVFWDMACSWDKLVEMSLECVQAWNVYIPQCRLWLPYCPQDVPPHPSFWCWPELGPLALYCSSRTCKWSFVFMWC